MITLTADYLPAFSDPSLGVEPLPALRIDGDGTFPRGADVHLRVRVHACDQVAAEFDKPSMVKKWQHLGAHWVTVEFEVVP